MRYTQITSGVRFNIPDLLGEPYPITVLQQIRYGSPNKSGSHDCHGAPLGDDEIKASREFLGWTGDAFEIPADIYAQWDNKDLLAIIKQQ